jgi:hypothetical protein
MEKAKAILFLNWTGEDFSHTWGGVEYTFKAGQTMYLEEGLAVHFAKHLANREINKVGKLMNDPLVKVFMERCYGTEFLEAKDEESLKTQLSNTGTGEEEKPKITTAKFCEFCDAVGPIKHKKVCPTQIKKDVPAEEVKKEVSKGGSEEEFEGLNDTK